MAHVWTCLRGLVTLYTCVCGCVYVYICEERKRESIYEAVYVIQDTAIFKPPL